MYATLGNTLRHVDVTPAIGGMTLYAVVLFGSMLIEVLI